MPTLRVIRAAHRHALTAGSLCLVIALAWTTTHLRAQSPPPLEHYRLVPGFLPEIFTDSGMAQGNGFATPNPWGTYTAYRLATNAKGQRTWRIENYLPNPNNNTAQGSSMYLFEGHTRALLVDTAQNTVDTPGQPDLKAVVRHLLSTNDDGSARAKAVDFVVANTHSHGDHTGKNSLMSDRAVYYPDLDWPRNGAPANYVPIKEGGGTTTHGSGTAASEIDLGDRKIAAISLYAHTPGSTGYLDRENQMVATGDAIGSAYVWAHFGSIVQYAASVRHLQDALKTFTWVAVLPAHFYQIKQGARGKPPINGRPLDKAYVDDQLRVAEGILNGTLVGEPYRNVGRHAAIATVDSAQVVYTLDNLGPADALDKGAYHAIAIPGPSVAPAPGGRFAAVDAIKSTLYLIRDAGRETMYLVAGSTKALLIGTGSGTPGIAAFAKKLTGSLPLEVIATSGDAGQIGGLQQFAGSTIYLPNGVNSSAPGAKIARVASGTSINLGTDRAGRPLRIEVHPLSGHDPAGITLLDPTNRVLFGGDALGTQGNDGLILHEPLAAFAKSFESWRTSTDGKYDVIYTAHNFEWFTSAAYVDSLHDAVKKGLAEGSTKIRSAGAPDVVASIVVTVASR